ERSLAREGKDPLAVDRRRGPRPVSLLILVFPRECRLPLLLPGLCVERNEPLLPLLLHQSDQSSVPNREPRHSHAAADSPHFFHAARRPRIDQSPLARDAVALRSQK